MAVALGLVTAGNDFASGDTVTDVTLDLAANPTVALGPTGDSDTGLSSPSANVLGVELGGSEKVKFVATGISLTGGGGVFREANDANIQLYGGSALGSGAGVILYGGTHSSLADDASFRADETTFTDQSGGTTYGKISGSGYTIGSTGNAVKAIWHSTESIAHTGMAAGAVETATVTFTGAATGDAVYISKTSTGYSTKYIIEGYVSSANTVTYAVYNVGGGAGGGYTGDIAITVLDIT